MDVLLRDVQARVDEFFTSLHRGEPLILGVGFGALLAAVLVVVFLVGENPAAGTATGGGGGKRAKVEQQQQQHRENGRTGGPIPPVKADSAPAGIMAPTTSSGMSTTPKSTSPPITPSSTPQSSSSSPLPRTGSLHRGSLKKRNLLFNSTHTFELFRPESDPNSIMLAFANSKSGSPVAEKNAKTMYLGRTSKVVDDKGNSFTVVQLGDNKDSLRVSLIAQSLQEKKAWMAQIEEALKTLQ